ARTLHAREELIRAAFRDEFEAFCDAVYGDKRQILFLNAAASLAQGGKTAEARVALNRAMRIAPHDPEVAAAVHNLDRLPGQAPESRGAHQKIGA
ncbi:MAG: hypothetical protein LIP28_02550, partial [Deltaproteobacteria bacterium]|nr:hypothetical protein [Deltaproteobacteria bacterium]